MCSERGSEGERRISLLEEEYGRAVESYSMRGDDKIGTERPDNPKNRKEVRSTESESESGDGWKGWPW